MLSLNNVPSSGSALHYFSKDNYYTLDEGLQKSEWFGIGAETLGYTGVVQRDDFFAALAGQVGGASLGKVVTDPETGEQLRQHRPGIDMTFSAPKSVSLLAEVGAVPEVRAAHEAAVKEALSYIEKELAATRVGTGGEVQTVKTGNLVVAMFRHNTSRELDPQTHTHAVVMNATQRPDGEWRSLTNEALYREQRTIGAVYTAALAHNLQRLGYELERTDAKGNFEIVGVDRDQIEHFSQRRAQIEKKLESRGLSLDTATAQQKEDATLGTRSHKKDVDHVALIDEWKDRAVEVGLNLDQIATDAREVENAGLQKGPSDLSGRQALEFAAAHLVEREVVVSRNDLLAAALEHGSGRVAPTSVLAAFDKLVADGDLVPVGPDEFTTKKMLGSELWALDTVRAEKGKTSPIMAPDQVSARIGEHERAMGWEFRPGQREAISLALTTDDRFIEVQGLAGTGKTTMLRALNSIAQDQGYVVRGMAPTGAAAKQMARESGIATDTVAMFSIKEAQLQKDIQFARQYAEFDRKPELWVVDESSFLAQRQKAQLDFMAQRAGAKILYLGDVLQLQGVEAGKPFELAQRDGIATAMMTEINRQKTPDLKQAVSIIVGQDAGAPAGPRAGGLALAHNGRAFKYLQESGRVVETGTGGSLSRVADDYLAISCAKRENTIVITAYNKDRVELNGQIREGLRKQGELTGPEGRHSILVNKGWTRAQIKEAQYYSRGDVVRVGRDYVSLGLKKGDYLTVAGVSARAGVVQLHTRDGQEVAWEPKKHNKVEVYESESRALAQGDLVRLTRSDGEFKNGEIARVVELLGNSAVLEARDGPAGARRTVNLDEARHWDHAYASTVHAAQGATKEKVLFHIPTRDGKEEQEGVKVVDRLAQVFGDRSFYVGTTRASDDLTIYTDDAAKAHKMVQQKQDKTSAVEKLRYVEIHQR